jgi:hypothetical protein
MEAPVVALSFDMGMPNPQSKRHHQNPPGMTPLRHPRIASERGLMRSGPIFDC